MWQGVKCQIYISEAIIILCKSKACHHRYSHFHRERERRALTSMWRRRRRNKEEDGSTFFSDALAILQTWEITMLPNMTIIPLKTAELACWEENIEQNEWMKVKVLKHTQETHGFICMAPHTPSTEAIDVRWDSANGIQGARHIYTLYIYAYVHAIYIIDTNDIDQLM